jgi:hypothetical protein
MISMDNRETIFLDACIGAGVQFKPARVDFAHLKEYGE